MFLSAQILYPQSRLDRGVSWGVIKKIGNRCGVTQIQLNQIKFNMIHQTLALMS